MFLKITKKLFLVQIGDALNINNRTHYLFSQVLVCSLFLTIFRFTIEINPFLHLTKAIVVNFSLFLRWIFA